jgi:hypothetical protein
MYDFKKCCIILLCKYMFKKSPQLFYKIIVFIYKDWLQGLMSVFKYFMFIIFIPNHSTRFDNIDATYSCEQIKLFSTFN